MTTTRDQLEQGLTRLQDQRNALEGLTQAAEGTRPASFLSKRSRDALEATHSGLGRLGVNFPRMLVRTMTDRLRVAGFRHAGKDDADAATWEAYRRAGLVAGSDLIHADRLLYGSAYVTVWGHAANPLRPVAAVDSPLSIWADVDPSTGEVRSALRRWHGPSETHAVLYTPEKVIRFRADGEDPQSVGQYGEGQSIPNPFGIVPVVPFIRRTSSSDYAGTSLVADVLDLSDAVSKVLQDALVTSEHVARPRRWATGLEIEEDEDGNIVDPFANDRKLQSESPETKFGQLAGMGLEGFSEILAALLQQIGAVGGLPAHYLGNANGEPPNADSIRAAEAQLTTAAYGEQRQLDRPWATVGGLLAAVPSPNTVDPVKYSEDLEPVWAPPELRTPAQAADAALKLKTVGVPLRTLLIDTLGHSPESADAIVKASRAEAVTRAAEQLGKLVP